MKNFEKMKNFIKNTKNLKKMKNFRKKSKNLKKILKKTKSRARAGKNF